MEKVKLKKIAIITAGQAAPKEFSNDGVPFIRAGHLEDLVSGKGLNKLPKVTEEIAKKNRLKKLPKGSILFAKSGMSAKKNRIYISEEDSYFVSHLAAILPSDNFNTNFLARYLNWFNPTNLILDDAYPSIRLEDINNLEIPLPNLSTQQKIANILDKADELRQYNKQLIEKYDALTQSLFLEMFGDPVSNSKNWKFTKGSKLYDVKGRVGWKGYKKTDLRKEGAIVLGATHVDKMGTIDLSKVVYLSEEKYLESPEIMVEKFDLIFVQRGNTIGKVGLVINDIGDATINPVVLIFRSKNSNPYFLLYLLMDKSMNREIVGSNSGSAQPMITQKSMNEIKLIDVPISLQNQFAERVKLIETQKQQAQEALTKSEALFQGLLLQAFNGELT